MHRIDICYGLFDLAVQRKCVRLEQRAFTGADHLVAMAALAAAFPEHNLHVADLPYRLSSWALAEPVWLHRNDFNEYD